jgi:hypothetical protein
VIFREDLVEPSSRCVWFETDEDAATLASFGAEADGLHVGQVDGNAAARSRTPRTAGVLVEHRLSAAEHWAARDRTLHLLFFCGPDASR